MAQNQLEKYIWLADTIYRKGRITLKDINNRWLHSNLSNNKNLTRRTFHNHRIAIEQIFDMNIVCDAITNEYYFENIEGLAKNKFGNWLLNSFSISNILQEGKNITDRIIIDEIPSSKDYLTEIIEAMRENKVIAIEYHPYWSNEAFSIELHSYFIKLFNKRWYVYGRTPDEDLIKVYALDRIISLRQTTKKFIMPLNFSADEHLYNSMGVMKNETEKPCEIVLKSYGDTTKYLRALPLHHSQVETETNNDFSLFKYWLSPTEDFYQEILRKREYIELISPESAKVKIKAIISKLSEYYL